MHIIHFPAFLQLNWNKYCQLHSLFNCASRSYKMNRAIRKNMFPEYIMSDHSPYEDVYTPRQTYTYQNGKFFSSFIALF